MPPIGNAISPNPVPDEPDALSRIFHRRINHKPICLGVDWNETVTIGLVTEIGLNWRKISWGGF